MSERTSVEAIITNKIIDKLQQGQIPWQKPWFGLAGTGNIFTHKPYGVINQLLVEHPGGYMSEKQMIENNVNITAPVPENLYKLDTWKKYRPTFQNLPLDGYHKVTAEEWDGFSNSQKFSALGDLIVNYWQKSYQKREKDGTPMVDDDGNPVLGKFPPAMRYVRVLWTGYTDYKGEMPSFNQSRIAKPEELIQYYVGREGIKLSNVYGNEAYFRPSTDSITLPMFEQFKKAEEYYGTAFHEMTHSTGVKNRLNRDMSGWFGDPHYAKEELIAELGSAFLCHHCGIEKTIDNTTAYIQSWLKALQNDVKLVTDASKYAGRATEFIIDGFEGYEEVEETKEEPEVTAPKALLSAAKKIAKDGTVSRNDDGTAFYANKHNSLVLVCQDLGFPATGSISKESIKRVTPETDSAIAAPTDIKEAKAMLKGTRQMTGSRIKGVYIMPSGAVLDLNLLETAIKAVGKDAEILYLEDKKDKPVIVAGEYGSALLCPLRTISLMQYPNTNYGYIA